MPVLPAEKFWSRSTFLNSVPLSMAAVCLSWIYGRTFHGGPVPFLTGFSAVVLSALLGGLVPGLMTTVLCALGSFVFLFASGFGNAFILTRTVPFILVGGGVSLALGHYKRIQADLTEKIRALNDASEAIRINEARLRIALESGAMGTWQWSLKSDVRFWSDTMQKLFGFRSGEFDGKLEELERKIHPDDLATWGKARNSAIRDGADYETEFRVIWPNGEIHWVLSRGRPILDSKGQPEQMLGVAFDITTRKQAEQKIRETLDALQKERQMREMFVFALTHDLRNPLTAILSCAELIMRQSPSGMAHEMAERIIKDGRRADFMITQLLDANRLRSGKRIALPLEETNLWECVTSVLKELELIHGNRFVLKSNTPIRGYWNQDSLRRILENLLTNALKYGEASALITIILARSTEDRVRLSVHNRGKPISPRDQESLFAQFRRTDDAIASGKSGWGVGLSVVQELAEAHGGKVSVMSGEGVGTTFTVELPLDARPFQAARSPAERQAG
jgi:PAS domain S-box-containing protein